MAQDEIFKTVLSGAKRTEIIKHHVAIMYRIAQQAEIVDDNKTGFGRKQGKPTKLLVDTMRCS
jgi:hypothetical protein